MATSPLAMWAAAIGLFLVFQTCWAQQGYVFYDRLIIFFRTVLILSVFVWKCRVCYRQVSRSQSYASSVSQSYQTCTRSWWRRRCRYEPCSNSKNSTKLMMVLFFCCSTRYRTGYVTRYRTAYSSRFACCSGYTQVSTQCLRKSAACSVFF